MPWHAVAIASLKFCSLVFRLQKFGVYPENLSPRTWPSGLGLGSWQAVPKRRLPWLVASQMLKLMSGVKMPRLCHLGRPARWYHGSRRVSKRLCGRFRSGRKLWECRVSTFVLGIANAPLFFLGRGWVEGCSWFSYAGLRWIVALRLKKLFGLDTIGI